MTQEDYIRLYEKYLQGNLSSEEQELLAHYKDSFELKDLPWDESLMGDREETKEQIYYSLQEQMSRKRIIPVRKWLIAASATIAILISGIFLYLGRSSTNQIVNRTEKVTDDAVPGGNKAVLVLSDGSEISLNNMKDGLIRRDGGTEINKDQAVIRYKKQSLTNETSYNTIYTPLGGQYQIELEDGSNIWLNAGSSIRFPTAFNGDERVVELTGEAYFEVAKNAGKPFIVTVKGEDKSSKMNIKVLGTHFNVKAYPDESFKTTLAEGSVKVSTTATNNVVLVPGQQSVLNSKTGLLKVSKANLKEALAWKNGYFVFDHENIQSIMKKLSRWYDVDVSYQAETNNKNFVGTISRDENLSQVLKMLELTGTVRFEIEGRKVYIR